MCLKWSSCLHLPSPVHSPDGSTFRISPHSAHFFTISIVIIWLKSLLFITCIIVFLIGLLPFAVFLYNVFSFQRLEWCFIKCKSVYVIPLFKSVKRLTISFSVNQGLYDGLPGPILELIRFLITPLTLFPIILLMNLTPATCLLFFSYQSFGTCSLYLENSFPEICVAFSLNFKNVPISVRLSLSTPF